MRSPFRRADETSDDVPDALKGTVTLDFGGASGIGGREENQDRFLIVPDLLVLSDGMGGHVGGALAAELTVGSVVEAWQEHVAAHPDDPTPDTDLLAAFVLAANDAVRAGRLTEERLEHMGATLVITAVVAPTDDGWELLVGTLGDSPAFVVRDANIWPVTHQHNLPGELVAAGVISEEEAAVHPQRNVVTRAVGIATTVEPDIVEVRVAVGEALIATSDGITDVLDGERIAQLFDEVVAAGGTAEDVAHRLVDEATAAGATDNVTATVLLPVRSANDATNDAAGDAAGDGDRGAPVARDLPAADGPADAQESDVDVEDSLDWLLDEFNDD